MTLLDFWPQIVIVVLYAMGLGIHLAKHGEPTNVSWNVWHKLISESIGMALLYWGGFFEGMI